MLVRIVTLAIFACAPALVGCDEPAQVDPQQNGVRDVDPNRDGTPDATPLDRDGDGVIEDPTPDDDTYTPADPGVDPLPEPTPNIPEQ